MTTILSILNQLGATRSKTEKLSILKNNIDNETLKEFFRLALSGSINFFQKKPIQFESKNDGMLFSLDSAMTILLEDVAGRKVTGNAARDLIRGLMESLHPDDAEVLQRILLKDPKCGTGSMVNDVWKDLVPEHPNLLASPYKKKDAEKMNWAAGVIVERKSDGLRISIDVQPDCVTVYSRAGNILDLHGRFDLLGTLQVFHGRVIDAELMVIKADGKYEDRKTGNGICSKAIKGTLNPEDAQKMVAVAWDIIDSETFWAKKPSIVGMETRFNQLMHCLMGLTELKVDLVRPIEHEIVYSLNEAVAIYEKYRAAGEEGAMLKEIDVLWEDRRSKHLYKMKAEETCELKVTGFNQGKGEFIDYVGSLILESDDGKLVVNMSGFPLKLRAEITANMTGNPSTYMMVEPTGEVTYTAMPGDTEIQINSIVEVMYNEKIKSRDSEIWSLFLPRFEKVRLDKTEANTLSEIK